MTPSVYVYIPKDVYEELEKRQREMGREKIQAPIREVLSEWYERRKKQQEVSKSPK